MSWAPVSSGGPAVAPVAVSAAPIGVAARERGYTDRRPGFVPMRPMAIGEILDGAMGMLRQAPAATLGLGAILAAVQVVLTIPLQWLSVRFAFSTVSPEGNAGFGPFLAIVGYGGTAIVTAVIATTCGGITAGFMACAVGESSLGRPVTLGGVWRQARPRMWALVGLSLFIGLARLVGAGLFGLGWLFLTAAFAVAVPALMLERATVFGAVGRSWNLISKDFFRVLFIRLVAIVIAWVLEQLLALPLELVGEVVLVSGGPEASGLQLLLAVFCTGIGTMIGSIVVAPFLGAVSAFLYIDRRMRSEGLDIEMKYRLPAPAVATQPVAAGSA